MRPRILALCAACAVLCPFPGGSSGPGGDDSAAAYHGRPVKRKACGKKRKKPEPPPVAEREVNLVLSATDIRFDLVDGMFLPVQLFANVFDVQGNLVGVYEELWEPIFDENGMHVGMNGVGRFTFDGTDPTLNGTLETANVSRFLGFDETGFFLLIETAGSITNASGDLAGTTGDVAMATTALLFVELFAYDSQVTLSLVSPGGDDDEPEPGNRRHTRRWRLRDLPPRARPRWRR